MSLVFQQKPVATIKGKATNSQDTYTINGVTTASTTPANAAAQINKILGCVGKSIAGDENMTRVSTEEVVDNE